MAGEIPARPIGRPEETAVPLASIEFAKRPFLHSFPVHSEALTNSLREIGMRHPVSLRRQAGGRYVIISGHRRLASADRLGMPETPARVFDEEALEDRRAVWLAIWENLGTRALSDVEKSLAVARIVEHAGLSKKRLITEALPLLGLAPHGGALERALAVSRLEPELLEAVASGRVPTGEAERLATMEAADRREAFRAATDLRLSTSRIRLMLDLILDISRRDGVPARVVVSEAERSAGEGDLPRPTPERAEAFLAALRMRRYPRWQEIEEKLEKRKEMLGLPEEVSMHWPDYLEGETVRAELRFRSAAELRKLASRLASLADDDALAEILRILQE